jgi:hypothetical protein
MPAGPEGNWEFDIIHRSDPMFHHSTLFYFTEQVEQNLQELLNPFPKYKPAPSPTRSPNPEDEYDSPREFYVTYTKTKINGDGTSTTYSGRTSGTYKGKRPTRADAIRAMKVRDSGHKKLREELYDAAVLDEFSTNNSAIRGREQQNVDYYGGARSDEGGTSRNAIRAVGKNNKNGRRYHRAANREFGNKFKYTGN